MLLDDHREEGLPGAFGQLAVRGVVRAGLIDGVGLDQQPQAHAPGDVGQGIVGKRARQLDGFGEVGQDLVERSRPARPGGVRERDHERAGVGHDAGPWRPPATSTRPPRRGRPDRRGRGSGAPARAPVAHWARQRPRGRPPAAGPRHAGRRCPGASRPSRIRWPRGPAALRRRTRAPPPRRRRSSPAPRRTGRRDATPALAGSGPPPRRGGRGRRGRAPPRIDLPPRRRRGSVPPAPPRRARTRPRGAFPAIGAAARKWNASSLTIRSRRPSGIASSASPTRRCSAAARTSSDARRPFCAAARGGRGTPGSRPGSRRASRCAGPRRARRAAARRPSAPPRAEPAARCRAGSRRSAAGARPARASGPRRDRP